MTSTVRKQDKNTKSMNNLCISGKELWNIVWTKKKRPTRWVVKYIKTASDKQFSKFYWNVHCTQYRERKRVSQIREKNPAQYNRKIIPAIGQIALKIIIKSYQYNNIIYCISCEMYIWNYKNWSKKNTTNTDIPRIYLYIDFINVLHGGHQW